MDEKSGGELKSCMYLAELNLIHILMAKFQEYDMEVTDGKDYRWQGDCDRNQG